MRHVVADASVLAAIAFGEPDAQAWAGALDGAMVHAPTLLRYELASVARKKCRAHPERARQVLGALELALEPTRRIEWTDPPGVDVALLANAIGISAYDAAYLWLAGFLGAELVTKDAELAAVHDACTMR